MRIHGHIGGLSLTACLILASACATSPGGSLATRLVKPGIPPTDLGGLPSVPPPTENPASQKAPPQPRATTYGASIESSDEQLANALLVEALLPTAANHLRVAREYQRLGILDASADHLSEALKKDPSLADAHEALARVWRAWGFPEEGLASAYRAVYFSPGSASAQNTLGTLLDALGEEDAAQKVYERALVLDRSAAWALNNLCDLNRRRLRLSEARIDCEAALRIAPNFVAAHNNLALTFASSGDFARARQEFLAGGDAAAAHYNIGMLFLAEHSYQAAAEAFETAIRARPEFTAAKTRAHAARLAVLTGEK